MSEIVRTEKEIDDTLNAVSEALNEGSKYPGMSYEQGIQDMYDWLMGYSDDNPMEIEEE